MTKLMVGKSWRVGAAALTAAWCLGVAGYADAGEPDLGHCPPGLFDVDDTEGMLCKSPLCDGVITWDHDSDDTTACAPVPVCGDWATAEENPAICPVARSYLHFGSADEAAEVSAVAVDSDGYRYLAVTVDSDASLSKYDASGNEVWTVKVEANAESSSVAVDSLNHVIVAGSVFNVSDGISQHTAFVKKYDTDGNLLWKESYGNSPRTDAATVAVDGADNVFVSGSTQGNLLGGGAAKPSGWLNAYVRKYDTNGTRLWTKQVGGYAVIQAFSMAVDKQGNVFLAERAQNKLDDAADDTAGNNSSNISKVSKFDANGNQVWTERLGSARVAAYALAVDDTGNLYVAGDDPKHELGFVVKPMASIGSAIASAGASLKAKASGAFVCKIRSTGGRAWMTRFGRGVYTHAYAVALDGQGKVVVAGGTLRGRQEGVASAGLTDAFAYTFDATGKLVDTVEFGSAFHDVAQSVAVDSEGRMVVAGKSYGALFGEQGTNSGGFVVNF